MKCLLLLINVQYQHLWLGCTESDIRVHYVEVSCVYLWPPIQLSNRNTEKKDGLDKVKLNDVYIDLKRLNVSLYTGACAYSIQYVCIETRRLLRKQMYGAVG